MTDKNQPLLAIVGPTAGGKTALSIALAKQLGGEIISCDSMQLYRGMDVGTAKPTVEEMADIPHHMIDIKDPDESYSCAEYVTDARAKIEDVTARGLLPILCGGTGLYLDAFLRGMPETPGGSEEIRQELTDLAQREGNAYLHGELGRIDPESAAAR